MKQLGTNLVKISAFLFIAAGASLASVGMPLAEYAKEARLLQFEVEETIGLELSDENCATRIASDHQAECRSALYTKNVTDTLNWQLNLWVNVFLISGIAFFLTGSAIYIKAMISEKGHPKSD